MGVICAFAAVACVDDTFDLDNLSTEMTVGGSTTILPLGYLENKTIAEMIGEQTVGGIEVDENGNLRFKYVGENSSMEMDSIASEFEIPEVENKFKADYPDFNIQMKGVIMEDTRDVSVSGLEAYKVSGDEVSGYNYSIPEVGELPVITGASHNILDGDDLHISFGAPEQVDKVTKVIFRDLENGHRGAPMHLTMNLNDLVAINNGGEMEINLKMSGGRFTILDAENKEVCFGDEYTATCPIEPGAETIDFAIYFDSLVTDKDLDEEHRLDIPLTLEYDVNFAINAKAGDFTLAQQPHVELFSDFEYGDAEVDANPNVTLIECNVKDGDPIKISGLPEQLKRVNKVDIEQNENAKMRLYVHGLEWMEENGNYVEVAITLPEFLSMHKVEGEDYTFDSATNLLMASATSLEEGVDIAIDAMDFGDEGKEPNKNGDIELTFEPHVVAHFINGTHLNVEEMKHEEELNITVNIDSTTLNMESVDGIIDSSYEVSEAFELPSFADFNLEVVGLGLKPVIEVKITHPLTMSAILSGSISPSTDGNVIQEGVVSFGPVNLPVATPTNGVVNPVEVILVIADESLREQYTDAKYTFVPCEVGKLLSSKSPDVLDISFEIAVDSTEVQTIVMSDNLNIFYDYTVDLPFVIDNSLEIYYRGAATGLNSLFSMVAGYNIKVGDVALIATIVNSTPLELGANIKLKDVDGNDTAAQLSLGDNAKIKGSSDGVTPAESVLRLVLHLGEDGKVTNVAAIDAIQIELAATSAAGDTPVPLNDSQYIGVNLQLELAGGITIDLNQLNQ